MSESDAVSAAVMPTSPNSSNGVSSLRWQELADTASGQEHWMAADNIHLGTEGHIYFAKELLKRWANEKAIP